MGFTLKVTLDLNTTLLRQLLEEADAHGLTLDKVVNRRLHQPLPMPVQIENDEDSEETPPRKPHTSSEPLRFDASYARNVSPGVAPLARRYHAMKEAGKVTIDDVLHLLNFVEPFRMFTYTEVIDAIPEPFRSLITPEQRKGWARRFYNRCRVRKDIKFTRTRGIGHIKYWVNEECE